MPTDKTTSLQCGTTTEAAADGSGDRVLGRTGDWWLPDGKRVSNIGLGTRCNTPDRPSRSHMETLIQFALKRGINLLSTDPSVTGHSETVLGQSLSKSFDEGLVRREQVVVVSKAGRVPHRFEQRSHESLDYERTRDEARIAYPSTTLPGYRCFDTGWIKESLSRSRSSLGVKTVDILMLDGLEWGLATWGNSWRERISRLFEALEMERSLGALSWYGVASRVGVFCYPGHHLHLPIEALVDLANNVSGPTNGFCFVEVPLNVTIPAAATRISQPLHGNRGSVLLAAVDFGLKVLASSPFNHGRVFDQIEPETVIEQNGIFFSAAQWMLQFVRSIPGVSCCILGTTDEVHLDKALAVCTHSLWDLKTLERIMSGETGSK